MNQKVITRFAPSPTGFLHIGSARTALFAYLYARKHGGQFILRIEDTDKSREVSGAIEHIQETLSWLGLDWDYGPNKPGPFGSCIQSERLALYRTHAEQLVAKGLAYPDPYSNEELAAFRAAADAKKEPFLFRNHRPTTFTPWDGTQPLRLKVPEVKRYTWTDAVRGELSAGPEMLDDIILIKADGYPTYNFAHIIDDLEMGVTHVMRGDEFISSTPKFLSIYDAIEVPYPVLVSLPPILRDDRSKKLGKRDGAKDILEYRSEGYLPQTMVNFLALIGWNPGTEQEIMTLDELINAFSLEHIQRGGGAFNDEKLQWMNKQYLNQLPEPEFVALIKPHLPAAALNNQSFMAEQFPKLIPLIRERAHTGAEVGEAFADGEYDFAYQTPVVTPELLKWKNDPTPQAALPRLKEAIKLLEGADFGSGEAIKAALWDYAESVGRGELLWPLRVSLTGKERSPDPFLVAFIIGKSQSISRLKAACATLEE
jgi:glutamyl-tRNA synthetase